jgi:hypothetical protein
VVVSCGRAGTYEEWQNVILRRLGYACIRFLCFLKFKSLQKVMNRSKLPIISMKWEGWNIKELMNSVCELICSWIEFLTMVAMKIAVCWDVTSCSLVDTKVSEVAAASFLHGEDDEGSMFLENLFTNLPNYTVSHSRRS